MSLLSASVTLVAACGRRPADAPSPAGAKTDGPPLFDDDVAFLSTHGSVAVLEIPDREHGGGGRVAVSAKYQGRVMTSAVEPGGRSLGWVHRAFIASGKTGTPFDNYGGEDRFWLGPEGGQFSLYFPPGSPFTFDAWKTPAAFQEGEWSVKERSPTSITFERAMALTSYAKTELRLHVVRTVRVLTRSEVGAHLGVPPPGDVRWVAFESVNRITNVGAAPWAEGSGLVSVWILGMFAPASDARVIIPYQPGEGSLVNDRYFGKVPTDRLAIRDGYLVFKCDGELRSKIGVGPARARNVAGSYAESARLLTVVQYDRPAGATRYVNSMWELQREPYAGDVVNSYNDGPTAPGKPSLGGFYEIESSSPAAALSPGESLVHTHRTFHFVGARASLDPIATKVLGVSVTRVVTDR